MPEYLAPGVYVEEVDTGNKPIEGVSTSTTGMLGVTERGPANVPVLVTSYGEYARWFGQALNFNDYSNGPSDRHCYLPHAVEGFFTNGGKRLYVVRALDTAGAVKAESDLFDRTPPAGAVETVLLRAAGELTGTAANPPLLVALDAITVAAAPDETWVRVGDGSTAEYHQVPASAADTTVVSLNFPLGRAHPTDGGPVAVDHFVIPAAVALNLTSGADAGAQNVTIDGPTATFITAALVAGGTVVLAIGKTAGNETPGTEYRFVTDIIGAITVVGPNSQATVRLDSPLLLAHAAGANVDLLDVATAPATPADSKALDTARAGDSLISVDDNSIFATGSLAVIRGSGAVGPEVRRVEPLVRVTFGPGAYEAYPAGTLVQAVDANDDTRKTAGALAATDTTVVLDSVDDLDVGQVLLIGAPGPGQKSVTLSAIDAGAKKVTFSPAAGAVFVAGTDVSPAPKSLTAPAAVKSVSLALDNRLGLREGDTLRIASGANEEFVTIKTVPGRPGHPVAPDAGLVSLDAPLALPYPVGGTHVFRVGTPAPAVAADATATVLPLSADDTSALLRNAPGLLAAAVARFTAFGVAFYHRVGAVSAAVALQSVTLDKPLLRPHGVGTRVAQRTPLLQVQALDAGAWGNRLRVSAENQSPPLAPGTTLSSFSAATRIRLASASGVEAGTVLLLTDPATGLAVGDPLKVAAGERGSTFVIVLDAPGLSGPQQAAHNTAVALGHPLRVQSREFQLTVFLLRQPDPALPSRGDTVIDSEVFRSLSMDPRHSRYVHKVVGDIDGPLRKWDRRSEGESLYVRVHDLAQDIANAVDRAATLAGVRLGPEDTLFDVLPTGRLRPARLALEAVTGDDSIPTLTDALYVGADDPNPENRTGLFSLQNVEEISIVACPGRLGVPIQQALIDHCELMRYRFAVLDGPLPPDNDSIEDVISQRQQFDTKYAALYHPWLVIPDPFPQNLLSIADYPVPPSGHVAGIYARVDDERGVHKAPANEVVRGITGLQRVINKGQQEILNPYPMNINVIRDFRRDERGLRVYGARVITSDSDWKYVNVRRLVIFIEDSIDRGLQWVVFEPNAEPLWARVRRSITNFLNIVWRNGALEGVKQEEAFFVKCDRTTMTQTDIDSGRLIVLVGVAPVKPAEFVIVRIGLFTARSD